MFLSLAKCPVLLYVFNMAAVISACARLLFVLFYLVFIQHKSHPVQLFVDAGTIVHSHQPQFLIRNDASLDYYFVVKSVLPRHGVTWRLCHTGFNSSNVPLVKWSKHGQTSLVIPGHDPPQDITIFMDISINPGPYSTGNGNDELHVNTNYSLSNTTITYSRSQLFRIRKASHCSIQPEIFQILKVNGILRFRGRKAGRRNYMCKIPVHVGQRFDHVHNFPDLQNRIPVLKPIVLTSMVSSTDPLKLCCLNTRSLKNKTADFVAYAIDSRADLFALTETWFTDIDVAHKVEATPPGFRLLDHPRKNRVGGGTALLFRDHLHVKKLAGDEVDSFEYSEWSVGSNTYKLRLVIIYRPPYSVNHPFTVNRFINEFANYLESIVLSPEPVLITGDFNIRVDISDDPNTKRFLMLLESMGLQQHINQPTHEMGHTLDLVITRQSEIV